MTTSKLLKMCYPKFHIIRFREKKQTLARLRENRILVKIRIRGAADSSFPALATLFLQHRIEAGALWRKLGRR